MRPYEPGVLNAVLTEIQWQRMIEQACTYYGLITYHTHIARRSQKGFPDLVCAGKDRVVFIECKKEKGGKLTPEQAMWLTTLRISGQLAMVARPRDWPLVNTALSADSVFLPEYREEVKGYGQMILPEVRWERKRDR